MVIGVVHGQQYGSSASPGSKPTFMYATYESAHGLSARSVVASTTTVLRLHRFVVPCQWNDKQVLAWSHLAAHASTDAAVCGLALGGGCG